MRISVIGDNDTARLIRVGLQREGFPVVDKPQPGSYLVSVEEVEAGEILLDSIDGPLERYIFEAMRGLTQTPITIQTAGGIQSQSQIAIELPGVDRPAVVQGVIHGILKVNNPALHQRVARASPPSRKRWFSPLLWLVLLAVTASAQQPSANQNVDIKRVGGTVQSAANVVDAANSAVKVNCILGCAASSPSNQSATGTLTALDGTVVMAVAGVGSSAVQITGTWVGTINFEATVNSAVGWFAVNGLVPTTAATVTSTTTNGTWVIPSAGYAQIRFRMNPFTSGTATINVQGSSGTQATINAANTVTANQGGAPWTQRIQDGAGATLATVTGGNALKVDGSAVTQPISAASLPLPTGASTAAKQPALGTAGVPSADVITIQGIASMTKLLVTPDSVALPANQSVNVAQVGGAATTTLAAGEQKVGIEGLAASGAAKSGNPIQTGGVFNTTQPTVTTGQAVEQQSTARGAEIVATGVDTFNVTVNAALPTGTNSIGQVTANAGTNLNTSALALSATQTDGTQKSIARGGAKGTTTAADVTSTAEGANNNALDVQIYSGGVAKDPTAVRALTSADTVTVVQATNANLKADVTSNAANISTETTVAKLAQTQGSTTAGQSGPLVQGAVTTAAPAYTTAQTSPLSLTTAGALRVDNSAVTQPVSGTITANAGTGTFTVAGAKTNNAAAPGATNVGVLAAVSTASAPAYTEGNLVALSVDNSGALRTSAAATTVNDVTATGDLVATGSVTTATLNGSSAVGVFIFGTWSATVQFEASIDGTNFFAANALPITTGNTATVTSTQSNGQWLIESGAFALVRARVSAFSSGTVSIRLRSSTGPSVVSIATPVRGGAKGGTVPADVTSTAQGPNNNALDVQLWVSGVGVDPRQIRSLTNTGDSVTVLGNKSTNSTIPSNTNLGTLPAIATAALSPVIEGNQVGLSTDLNSLLRIIGSKTNNNAAPGATNVGALTAVSTAAAPAYTEGNLVALSVDNSGSLRTSATSVSDVTATGDLVATGSVTTATLNGSSAVGVFIFGTWAATVQFEASIDGTTFFSVNALPVTGGALVTSTTANGQWTIESGSFALVRARVSAFTSGTVSIRLRSSTGPSVVSLGNSIPTGTNSIGTVTTSPPANASTNVTQFGGTNVSTGTGASGVGIPRVTISNDSSLAANQSVNVAQVAGATTTTLAAGEQKNGVEGLAASGAAKSGNPVQIGGVFNTTQPTVTTGQAVEQQSTARGAAIVATGADTFNVTVNAALPTGTNTIGAVIGTLADNGVAAATNRIGTTPSIYQTSYLNGTAATQGRNGALSQGTDGLLWTANLPAMRPASYSASATVASAASATDIAVLPGNASNTVLVTKVIVTCTQTTAGIITLNLIKRSTADSAGTSAAMTVVPDDSNYAAGVSAPLTYTANPTLGTAVGNVDTWKGGCMATGTATPNDIYIFNRQQKPIVLRGTAQQLAVNLGATTVTGGSFTVTYQFIETATIVP